MYRVIKLFITPCPCSLPQRKMGKCDEFGDNPKLKLPKSPDAIYNKGTKRQ